MIAHHVQDQILLAGVRKRNAVAQGAIALSVVCWERRTARTTPSLIASGRLVSLVGCSDRAIVPVHCKDKPRSLSAPLCVSVRVCAYVLVSHGRAPSPPSVSHSCVLSSLSRSGRSASPMLQSGKSNGAVRPAQARGQWQAGLTTPRMRTKQTTEPTVRCLLIHEGSA